MVDDVSPDEKAKDLLGDPLDQNKETWGRPKYEITKENQEVVAVLRSAGWTLGRIARHLGISIPTLKFYFSIELDGSADRSEAMALLAIHRRAQQGNVTAARHVIAMAEKGRALPPERMASDMGQAGADRPETAPQAKPAEKLGKKEQLNEAAKKPLGGWGDLLN